MTSSTFSFDAWLEQSRERHLGELFELLRIPSVSTDPAYREDVLRCADWLAAHLREIGMKPEVMPTAGYPVVYAEHIVDPALPTVLIYGHYDVQPPEPLELWTTPAFEPTLRDGNIYARGATDDKGQFFSHIKGLEAHLKVSGQPPVNVKVLIEGEEEIGSPNLRPFLEANRERLACDAVLISDTSMHAPGRPAVMVGLRGLAYVEVSVRGPSHDLHSGLYGGAVPNPINALAQMIARLHDADGRVAIPGFYDNVHELSDDERAALRALAQDERAFCDEVGIPLSTGEQGYDHLERTTTRPTLDCNGIWGGYIGSGAKTVLPSEAHAKISCRLVPNQDPERITKLLREHLAAIAPEGVQVDVRGHHGGKPWVAAPGSPYVDAVAKALTQVWGVESVFTRGGGSIPIVADFYEVLGVDSVLMGLGLQDDRLHSPNEKFGLENYYQGIRSCAAALDALGALGR